MALSYQSMSTLSLRHLIFLFSLVLFEFTVYIAHDMIQPGMLLVTSEFNAGTEWVSASLSGYLIGGMSLQWLLGSVSDKYGRRPVMLAGATLFLIACLLVQWVSSIEQFIMLRFLQGISMGFLGAVGYAAVQEAFTETISVRATAMMANIALLAPLLGPLTGAAFIEIAGWRDMFYLFAILTAISLVGLWRFMPETAGDKSLSISLKSMFKNYLTLAKDRQVMCGSLAIGMVFVPLLAWVALSPVILIHDRGLDRMTYGLLQLPVFLAMIAGNLTLSKLVGHMPIEQPIRLAAWPILIGLPLAVVAALPFIDSYQWMIVGLSFYSYGAGVVNAGLYRLTLFSSNAGKGSVAAMLGMVSITVYTIGIEVAKFSLFISGNMGFSLVNLISGLLWFFLVAAFLRERKQHTTITPLK